MIEFNGDAPLLVFGGPYSNLPAAVAMRAEADRLGISADRVICTGDIVAYCAEPEATAALVRDWGIHVIAGNCEEQLAVAAADCGCGFAEDSACDRLARGWYPYANARITDGSRRWMAALPATLRFRLHDTTFQVVHGGVARTNRFVFASDAAILRDELATAAVDIVIAGHAGLPFIARAGHRTWFNTGVIGMPANDGTPAGWYGLVIPMASGAIRLETRRLAYDHHAAAASLRRAGHANAYARTLVTGLWPSLDILPAPERAATGRRLRARVVTVKAATATRDNAVAHPVA
jgi:predicted phosphodiesterase